MAGMNANAKLYDQSVPYSASEGPYQCLSLPWWVQTRHPTYYPRHRCDLEPLICGEAVFRKIEQDLKKAKHTVDIITWGFDPGMVLRRGATANIGQRYGDLLKEIATRKTDPVMVRLLVWHDDMVTEWLMKNNPGYYGTRFPAVGCANGGYYTEEHRNYNAEWFEQVYAEKIPNICLHVRAIPIELFPRCLYDEEVPTGAAARGTARCATHHQKMLLIDYEDPPAAVGYVMGHNSITDFWDTAEHKFRDPRRETFYKQEPEEAWKQGPALDPALARILDSTSPRNANWR